jgi:acetyl-CoA/propionyl-CoA carboxylase biotin carboxyl carrier protein
MVEVRRPDELAAAVESARRTARSAFGDDTLLVERLIPAPRHIEVQVMADAYGSVIHLGERECSLQRRHQKIVEEAPSALLTPEQRAAIGVAACDAARAVGYTGAGTVEFILSATTVGDGPEATAVGDGPEAAAARPYFFMEMNTRLQVEHPVTELVTGLDLVELQLRVAAGEPLPLTQDDVRLTGHAVEVRVYAEQASISSDTGGVPVFLPTGGDILALHEPSGTGIRVDSGVVAGGTVGSDYDPMLSKIIAHGADRAEALRRLDAALGDTVLLGVETNIGFLRAMLGDPDVRAGRLDTGLVGRRAAEWIGAEWIGPPDDVLAAAAAHEVLVREPSVGAVVDPFDVPGGWRVGEPAWAGWRMSVSGHDPVPVRIRGRARQAEVAIGEAAPRPVRARWSGPAESPPDEQLSGDAAWLVVDLDGIARRYACAVAPDGALWLGRDGRAFRIREQAPSEQRLTGDPIGGGPVCSPMPGTVTVVAVTEGRRVAAGDRLVIVEAMKMEHVLTAPVDGVVRDLRATAGGPVARDEVLLTIVPVTVEPVNVESVRET